MTGADPIATGEDWTEAEVRESVHDYLAMLLAEADGSPYSKADHRRELLSRLRAGRSAAAVEFKHQNISAAMVDLGMPYIRGYKPRGNYQRALVDEIRAQLSGRPAIFGLLSAGRAPRRTVGAVLVEAPKSQLRRPGVSPGSRVIDYLALQAENARLGRLGEELVVELEEKRLTALGREDLAENVRWVASIDGDGAGYDILSYESNGTERQIEVKTTALDAETPFYLSSAELAFAREKQATYRLYRVYDVVSKPKVFIIDQCLDDVIELVPVTFRARLAVK